MTLDTTIAITGPVDARAVYEFMRPLVGTPKHIKPEIKDESIWNPLGIGADAWLIVVHGANNGAEAMPRSPDCDNEDEEDREYSRANPRHNGTAHVVVSIDTAYGYRNGSEGCSDLHARLIRALGQWLDARSVPWKWQNEFTGEWFDRYDSLDSFGNAFAATGAESWFTTVVKPAIESGLLR